MVSPDTSRFLYAFRLIEAYQRTVHRNISSLVDGQEVFSRLACDLANTFASYNTLRVLFFSDRCCDPIHHPLTKHAGRSLSLIHISEPTRQAEISYAVFCLKKKKH